MSLKKYRDRSLSHWTHILWINALIAEEGCELNLVVWVCFNGEQPSYKAGEDSSSMPLIRAFSIMETLR